MVVLRKFLIHPSLSILCRWCSFPVGNVGLFWIFRIWKQSVQSEDICTVFNLFQSGYFSFTFDLKSGYYHVEIFPDHRQYLGFSWNLCSAVLPFGMSSAPYNFIN